MANIQPDEDSFTCTNCDNKTWVGSAYDTDRPKEKLCVRCYEYIHDCVPTTTRAGTVRESTELSRAFRAINEMLNCGETESDYFNERYDE